MIINNIKLFRKVNNNTQYIELFLNEYNTIDNLIFYSITGKTGSYKHKINSRPLVIIDRTKIKKTIKDQAIYQFNNLINSYLNKGYKNNNNENNIRSI